VFNAFIVGDEFRHNDQ